MRPDEVRQIAFHPLEALLLPLRLAVAQMDQRRNGRGKAERQHRRVFPAQQPFCHHALKELAVNARRALQKMLGGQPAHPGIVELFRQQQEELWKRN